VPELHVEPPRALRVAPVDRGAAPFPPVAPQRQPRAVPELRGLEMSRRAEEAGDGHAEEVPYPAGSGGLGGVREQARGIMATQAPEDSRDRDAAHALIGIGIAFVAALAVLYTAFHGRSTRFEDLALDEQTTSVYATVDGDPIHCLDAVTFDACLAGLARRGSARATALWLGNSQLHAINQWREGQETAPAMLARWLRERGIDLLTISPPNGSLREHLVLYADARTRMEPPLKLLILPVVFDDLREMAVRDDIAAALARPDTAAVLARSEAGRGIARNHESVSDPDRRALDQTVQELSEAFLDDWMERHSEVWALRAQARGDLLSGLHRLRNSVFRIRPDSKRHLVEGRYRMNLAAFEAILTDAGENDVSVLVYVAPLRNDVETPYVEAEYRRFKQDVEEIVARHGVRFVDLENLVPGELWGAKGGTGLGGGPELDFMHFQGGGHVLLARRLETLLEASPSPIAP